MRVKVGNRWYTVTPDCPLGVEFSARDCANLKKFLGDPAFRRYGVFHDSSPYTEDEQRDWLSE